MTSSNPIHVLARGVLIDQGHLLVSKTLDLISNFYFLPGGHVEHQESVEQTVLRELKEESGSKCIIDRFLGCLEYRFEPGHSSICHNHEYNFIFEVSSKNLRFPQAIPQCEPNLELLWMPLSRLKEIDFRPSPLKILIPKWLKTEMKEAFHSSMP